MLNSKAKAKNTTTENNNMVVVVDSTCFSSRTVFGTCHKRLIFHLHVRLAQIQYILILAH